MLYFLYVALFISVITLFNYIVSGSNAKQHRLLPLLLGYISVYIVHSIMQYYTISDGSRDMLGDILIIQIICLLTFSSIDYIQCKPPRILQALNLFGVIVIILLALNGKITDNRYYLILRLYVCFNNLFLLYAGILSSKSKDYMRSRPSKWIPALVILLLPSLSIDIFGFVEITKNHMPEIYSTIFCLLINYSIITGELIDLSATLESQAFNNSRIATIFLDSKFKYVKANQAASKLLDVDFNTSGINDLIALHLQNLGEISKNTVSKYKYNYKNMVLEQYFSPVYRHKKLVGYTVTLIDITDAENELLRIEADKKHAQEVAEAKSRFLADMSHELRSPVHAIIGTSDIILNKDTVSPADKSLLLYIKNSGNELLERINSILLFSKLEAKKLTLESKEYAFGDMLTSVAQTTIINLQDNLINFNFNYATPLPVSLVGDQSKVKGILQNLLSNAIKYTKKGSISCDISAEKDGDRWKIAFTVKDTGCGMTEEQIIKATEAYSSFADEMVVESTGLGLPIVKETVELMDGALLITSDGKTGTRVEAYFYQGPTADTNMLPAGKISKSDLLYGNMFAHKATKPGFTYPEAKVLMADDMSVNRMVFEKLVAPWEFQLDSVADGFEAVEKVKENKYDLIFLDQMMPVMDGFAAIKEIKELTKVPVVLFTANVSGDIKEKCLEAGFTEYLEKPIPAAQLKEVIEKYLPESLALPVTPDENNSLATNQSIINYTKNLRIYFNEMQKLRNELPELYPDNLALFKTRVHGVKSASKQLNKEAFGTNAEIFEMAAICENRRFIDAQLPRFFNTFDEFLEEVEKELYIFEQKVADIEAELQNADSSPVSDNEPQLSRESALSQLLSAFDDYDVNKIDYITELIKNQKLVNNTDEFCKAVLGYRAELEYEAGAEYVKSYINE